MSTPNFLKRAGIVTLLGGACLGAYLVAQGQALPPPDPLLTLQSLKDIQTPEPQALMSYVKSRPAAILLGKALFWDMNVGSDGLTACGSCHFQAGADNRVKNQLSPDVNNQKGAPFNATFNKPFPTEGGVQAFFSMASGGAGGPNYTLNKRDFPTHQLQDPLDRNSAVLQDTDDVVSSQGVFFTGFKNSPAKSRMDDCDLLVDPVYSVQGHQTRRVEPRNTPTVINMAFQFRTFWDGRANNIFNGSNPFGRRDPDAGIWVNDPISGLGKVKIALENSAAASQAAGPPGSIFEMSCGGRMFADIGRRLLPLKALFRQGVHAQDSVLGPHRAGGLGFGLKWTYAKLVQDAFQDKFWNSAALIDLAKPGDPPKLYTHMEANMSLFFPLAIQMYEGTLKSDEAPLDKFLGSSSVVPQPSQLSAQEQSGMGIFMGKGGCINCHRGPDLTGAGFVLQKEAEEHGLVERMIMGDNALGIYDNGFYNIGVRPTVEDIGVGGKDPFGNPLSFTRQYKNAGFPPNGVDIQPDRFQVDPCKFTVLTDPNNCSQPPAPGHRVAVDGSFKVPGLRNVELTGPYFHNGSRKTLEEVVEFYNRGGDRRGQDSNDTTGFNNADAQENNGSNLDADIKVLGLSDQEKADLVAFLKKPLTDERVRWEKAPFDHPQLFVPDGHPGNEASVQFDASGKALDMLREVKAVGTNGRTAAMGALKPFTDGLAP